MRREKKNGKRLVDAKNYRFLFKKKIGTKWTQGEYHPFSKNGRQKKNGGGAHRFFDEKKSPIFLIHLATIRI